MIELVDVSVRQGAFRLSGASLCVPTGRYGVLMGRTGSGKTTVLEAIAGLRPIASGRIRLAGVDATDWPPWRRGVGYVPQDAALFGTMTVAEHFAFALRLRGDSRAAIAARVQEMAQWLGVTHLLPRRPPGLSGGEAQRVALGRALAHRPPVLLLDEPLSALDADMREALLLLLESIRHSGATTVLHVTHNRAEAERLADVRFLLEDGQIREMVA